MACGCIVANSCPACGDPVWEDEWIEFQDQIMHERCKKKYIKDRYGMSEPQFLRLMGAQVLKREIELMRQVEIESHRNTMEQLDKLAERLNDLEKRKGNDDGKT